MKEATEQFPAERSQEAEGFSNRKLIRPSLHRNDHAHNHVAPPSGERRERPERAERSERADRNGAAKKVAPPEQTNAENFYYQKQMQTKTPMVLVLQDGEEIHGVIEWYDKCCLKVNRNGSPNLLIYKPAIKYMYKASEGVRK